MPQIDIFITDTTTGETRRHIGDDGSDLKSVFPDEQGELSFYMWEEGNYACDCNRYLFFERAGGQEPASADYRGEGGECGDTRYSVTIKIDDVVEYEETTRDQYH